MHNLFVMPSMKLHQVSPNFDCIQVNIYLARLNKLTQFVRARTEGDGGGKFPKLNVCGTNSKLFQLVYILRFPRN